jgi:hypothetical protein
LWGTLDNLFPQPLDEVAGCLALQVESRACRQDAFFRGHPVDLVTLRSVPSDEPLHQRSFAPALVGEDYEWNTRCMREQCPGDRAFQLNVDSSSRQQLPTEQNDPGDPFRRVNRRTTLLHSALVSLLAPNQLQDRGRSSVPRHHSIVSSRASPGWRVPTALG